MDAAHRLTSDVARGRRSRVVLAPLGWRQVGDDALHRADDGDSDVMDTGESTKETVKTIAQGMPVIRLHLWRLRSCAFSQSHAGPWVLAEAPGIPCALCFERDNTLARPRT